MPEALAWVLATITGLLLGAMFFGGLWWTVRKGVASPQPALWFLGSVGVRMSLALAGFYYVGRGHALRLVACLLGFVVARLIVIWLTRPPGELQSHQVPEVSDAP